MDNYIGEIRLVGFTFAPLGWLMCDGSLQSIANYEALYALLGTTYGGDGQSTFGLPDLRGRVPISQGTWQGSSYSLGQMAGSENVTVNYNQLPMHLHSIAAGTATSSSTPSGNVFSSNALKQYQQVPANATTGNMLTAVGGSQPHANVMPYQAANYIIATEGIYPSSN